MSGIDKEIGYILHFVPHCNAMNNEREPLFNYIVIHDFVFLYVK